MAHRIAVYGRDMNELRQLKKDRTSPAVMIMTRDVLAFREGDVEDCQEVLLLEPNDLIAEAYEAKGIPVSILKPEKVEVKSDLVNEVKVIETGKQIQTPVTAEDLRKQAAEEAEAAKVLNPYTEISTKALKDHLKKTTGRTPSDEMSRERALGLIIDMGVKPEDIVDGD